MAKITTFGLGVVFEATDKGLTDKLKSYNDATNTFDASLRKAVTTAGSLRTALETVGSSITLPITTSSIKTVMDEIAVSIAGANLATDAYITNFTSRLPDLTEQLQQHAEGVTASLADITQRVQDLTSMDLTPKGPPMEYDIDMSEHVLALRTFGKIAGNVFDTAGAHAKTYADTINDQMTRATKAVKRHHDELSATQEAAAQAIADAADSAGPAAEAQATTPAAAATAATAAESPEDKAERKRKEREEKKRRGRRKNWRLKPTTPAAVFGKGVEHRINRLVGEFKEANPIKAALLNQFGASLPKLGKRMGKFAKDVHRKYGMVVDTLTALAGGFIKGVSRMAAGAYNMVKTLSGGVWGLAKQAIASTVGMLGPTWELENRLQRISAASADSTSTLSRMTKDVGSAAQKLHMTTVEAADLAVALSHVGLAVEDIGQTAERVAPYMVGLGLSAEQVGTMIEAERSVHGLSGALDGLADSFVSMGAKAGIPDLIKELPGMLDHIREMSLESGQAFGLTFGAKTAKAATALATTLQKKLGVSLEKAVAMSKGLQKSMAGAFTGIQNVMAGMASDIDENTLGMFEVFARTGRGFVDMQQAMQEAAEGLPTKLMQSAAESFSAVRGNAQLTQRTLQQLINIAPENEAMWRAMAKEPGKASEMIRDATEAMAANEKEAKQVAAVGGRTMSSLFNEITSAIESFPALMGVLFGGTEIKKAFDTVGDILDKLRNRFANFIGSFLKDQKKLDRIGRAIERIGHYAERAIQVFADWVDQLLTNSSMQYDLEQAIAGTLETIREIFRIAPVAVSWLTDIGTAAVQLAGQFGETSADLAKWAKTVDWHELGLAAVDWVNRIARSLTLLGKTVLWAVEYTFHPFILALKAITWGLKKIGVIDTSLGDMLDGAHGALDTFSKAAETGTDALRNTLLERQEVAREAARTEGLVIDLGPLREQNKMAVDAIKSGMDAADAQQKMGDAVWDTQTKLGSLYSQLTELRKDKATADASWLTWSTAGFDAEIETTLAKIQTLEQESRQLNKTVGSMPGDAMKGLAEQAALAERAMLRAKNAGVEMKDATDVGLRHSPSVLDNMRTMIDLWGSAKDTAVQAARKISAAVFEAAPEPPQLTGSPVQRTQDRPEALPESLQGKATGMTDALSETLGMMVSELRALRREASRGRGASVGVGIEVDDSGLGRAFKAASEDASARAGYIPHMNQHGVL